jgi:hypothetical protein
LSERTLHSTQKTHTFPWHGYLGLGLIAVFWTLNWTLDGPRTQWGFFPLWLGYCLTIDGLVHLRKGTSMLARNWRKYAGLFLLSAPVWWLFEAINWRVQNWHYQGAELFTPLQFTLWATLSFTTVIPAVFGSAEFVASFDFLKRLGKGPVVRSDRAASLAFFIAGTIMFVLMWAWPHIFFPFVWISVYFIMEPINIWLGNRHIALWTGKGDWRPVLALWIGVLMTAFFWEMWNYYSYPKWIYTVPYANWLHIFEMPLLGYGGYLPFALELYAVYHLATGLLGDKTNDFVRIHPDLDES